MQVAVAIDKTDYSLIAKDLKEVEDEGIRRTITTPDNEYICLYWEDACWYTHEMFSLRMYPFAELEAIKHAVIIVDDNGAVSKSIKTWDDRGSDEEFDSILSVDSQIYFWDFGREPEPFVAYHQEPGNNNGLFNICIYQITLVSSEGFYTGRESHTWYSVNQDDVIVTAYQDYAIAFDNAKSEGLLEDLDEEPLTKEAFSIEMKKGFAGGDEYVIIQYSDSHQQYEALSLCIEQHNNSNGKVCGC